MIKYVAMTSAVIFCMGASTVPGMSVADVLKSDPREFRTTSTAAFSAVLEQLFSMPNQPDVIKAERKILRAWQARDDFNDLRLLSNGLRILQGTADNALKADLLLMLNRLPCDKRQNFRSDVERLLLKADSPDYLKNRSFEFLNCDHPSTETLDAARSFIVNAPDPRAHSGAVALLVRNDLDFVLNNFEGFNPDLQKDMLSQIELEFVNPKSKLSFIPSQYEALRELIIKHLNDSKTSKVSERAIRLLRHTWPTYETWKLGRGLRKPDPQMIQVIEKQLSVEQDVNNRAVLNATLEDVRALRDFLQQEEQR